MYSLLPHAEDSKQLYNITLNGRPIGVKRPDARLGMRQQTSELLQNLDALLRVGMGGEERCEESHALAAAQSLRMHDEQLCHIVAFHILQSGFVAYLAQCRGEGERIAAEFSTAGISHIFALAADGETGEQGEEIGYDAKEDGNQEH